MRALNLGLGLACVALLGCGYIDNPSAEASVGEGGSTDETLGDSTGDGDSTSDVTDATNDATGEEGQPEAPMFELSLSQVKQFDFSWMPALGAQYYQLLESVDGNDSYVQVGDDVVGLTTSLVVPLHFRLNASYKLRACNDHGCTDSDTLDVEGPLVEAIGYFKASNTGVVDHFGTSVALSADGNTLAVGAPAESSNATGIGGDQSDNSASSSGAVYVFARDDQNTWVQQAYVKDSTDEEFVNFGVSLALSSDGDTLTVGAPYDGIGGAVYVFVRDDQNAWSQQARVETSNPGGNDNFGRSVALSSDGDILAVGAPGDASAAMGIGGSPFDDSAPNSGAAHVFVRDDQNGWSQQEYIKASNTSATDYFGTSVALSSDGNTLAVGALREDSNATSIGGNQANDSASDAGAVYVFVRDVQNEWSQQAYVKAFNSGASDLFGADVVLSGDGNTLAVGATWEDSNAMVIGGNQTDNSASDAGAVYVFVRDQNAWSQQAYVKASNSGSGDTFGSGVALSNDGNTLAVGAEGEGSNAMGIGGNQADDSAPLVGAVYVFVRDDQNAWSQQAYTKASNSGAEDRFGWKVALSGDGNTLAVGAYSEDSNAMGIGGNQTAGSAPDAGAVYLY